MATNKAPRIRRRRQHQIDFPDVTLPALARNDFLTYRLPDISDSATIEHHGEQIELTISNLIDIRVLGHGNFAAPVLLSEVKDHSDLRMAVKKLPLLQNDRNPEGFTAYVDLRAIREISSEENTHVTKFFAAILDIRTYELIICMEACDASMDRFARQMHSMKLAQDLDIFLKRLINHIADALRFLKTKNILHRDIKPSNILINQRPFCFKLCDFGFAQIKSLYAYPVVLSYHSYVAPEQFEANTALNEFSVRSDMWALGISVMEITNGVHPFEGLTMLRMHIKVKEYRPELSIPLSGELIELIEWLLKFHPNSRPVTYDEILSSLAMASMPAKVTEAEQRLVDQVIPKIPEIGAENDS